MKSVSDPFTVPTLSNNCPACNNMLDILHFSSMMREMHVLCVHMFLT